MKIEFTTTPHGLHIVIRALDARIAEIRAHSSRSFAEEPTYPVDGFLRTISSLEGVMFQLKNEQDAYLQAEEQLAAGQA